MLYVIGLAVASILGIFGFVVTSSHKENNHSELTQTSAETSADQPQPQVPAANQPKKLPVPLAIFGVIGSMLVSVVSLVFFFGRSQQSKRDNPRRLQQNPRTRQNPNFRTLPRNNRLPQQTQRTNQSQPRKKKGWW